MKLILGLVVTGGVLLGCGKKKDDAAGPPTGATGQATPAAPEAVDPSKPCPALAITVDGVPLEGLVHGQGVTMKSGSYTTQMVNLSTHDKATCEEALKGSRSVQEGEVYAKAFHGEAPGVGIDVYTHVEGTITLDKVPDKVGDQLAICVRLPVVFTPNAGAFEGKRVSIVGTFAGTYCGVNGE